MPKDYSLDQKLYSVSFVCPRCGITHDQPAAVCGCGTLLVEGLMPGAIIAGRYKYLATIGNGGMGLIVKAYDPHSQNEVALKLLLRNNNSPEVKRFMRECQATSTLCHPSIVNVLEYGVTDDGFPYMAMEYLPGIDLGTAIASQGALDVKEAISIFEQLCDTLSYAHSKGIVHRDIKPSNIMLPPNTVRDRKIKIVDFGIAKLTQADQTGMPIDLTQTGQIVGSPLYMSPEQALGKTVDQRTDIYSAACVLYHALTGAPPVQGNSAIETLFKHVNEVPPSMSEASLGKKFEPALERVVCKALKKDPNERYQSFDEMKQALLVADGRAAPSASPPEKDEKGSEKPRRNSSDTILFAAGAFIAILIPTLIVARFTVSVPPKVRQPNKPVASVVAANAKQSLPDVESAVDKESSDQIDGRNAIEGQFLPQLADGNLVKKIVEDCLRLPERPGVIWLTGNGINDSAIEYFIRIRAQRNIPVEALLLNDSSITDEALRMLAASHIQLKELSLAHTNITGKGLNYLNQMHSLQKLNIAFCQKVRASELKSLGKLKRLQELQMPHVCHSSEDSDFKFLSALTSLHKLNMTCNRPLPPAIFRYAEFLPELTSLECRSSGLTNKSLEDISNIGAIESLCLQDNNYTDAGISALTRMHLLTNLIIGGTSLTANTLPTLAKMTNLRQLMLICIPGIPPEKLQRLRKALPDCNVVYSPTDPPAESKTSKRWIFPDNIAD